MALLPENAKEIFVEAIEKYTPNQWAEFLNEACGDDTQLRRRVEILLEAHIGDESLLDRPAIAPAETIDQPTERPGIVIGPYKLRELTSSSSRSARGAWVSSTWRSRRNPSAARSR
jgi:hypothetical protein